MRRLLDRSRLSYANVIATLGLFIALGGTSYAVAQLPKDSVGSKQIRRAAVRSAEVKNGTLKAKDFAAGQVPVGPAGPRGPAGPAGPKGATGAQGIPGAATLPQTLPPGRTLRGTFSVLSRATSGGDWAHGDISFQPPLASAPQPHLIQNGQPTTVCPGSDNAPTAAPGHLCVYVDTFQNVNVNGSFIFNPSGGAAGADELGAAIRILSNGAGQFFEFGTWAVTAP